MNTRKDKIVSNTYLAFLRTFDEVSKGINISEKLFNIKEHDKFSITLNNVIREIYNGENPQQAINDYDDSRTLLFETDSDGIGFFLLETHKYLILLNIIEMKNSDGTLELIPSAIENYDKYVKRVNIGGKTYKVTNTYNSLLSFAKLNNLEMSFDLNSIFFDRFVQSLNTTSALDVIIDSDRSVEEFAVDENGNMININMIFNYVVADKLIIVVEYGAYI
jgi:hypothetical protein